MKSQLSALNNSSIDDSMSLDDILRAADERNTLFDEQRETSLGQDAAQSKRQWRGLLETAKQMLPLALQPFVRSGRDIHREDQPNEIAVALDLPESERIFFGPWVYNEDTEEFDIQEPWRNKPFVVGGGTMEEYGDLLDAIARAREVFKMKHDGQF